MTCTWQDLRELRAAGHRPSQALVITTDRWFAFGFDRFGVMAILHEAGKPMPVELLHGLDVILWLRNCDQTSAVYRLCKAKSVIPSSMKFFCRCFGILDWGCTPCRETRETMAMFDSLPGAA